MRLSRALIPTLKETPKEAQVVSHRLMLRSGMIRQLTAGVYNWLPLGLKVLRRVEAVVRREMDAAGAQEVLMPAVQPAELWMESGRWQHYGKELLRLRDRHEREFCFGPTHEEVIADLVRREVRSYKQLPANFYQIQTKFRDEIRPRFGIMRGREFLMKDAYSFDVDDAGLDRAYRTMFTAYQRIFRGCGLAFRAVEADTGSIGGASSHEFHVLADAGEDVIASCSHCDYAANLEKAVSVAPAAQSLPATQPLTKAHTPGVRTIEEVATRFQMPLQRVLKSLVVESEQGGHLVLLRGDHALNEIKLAHALGVTGVRLPDSARVRELAGVAPGAVGPLGCSLPVLADHAALALTDFICGAAEDDHHLTGVNWGRDLPRPVAADIRNVNAGEPCPRCAAGHLKLDRGIEVGHVFKLGTKYSEALGVRVLDDSGAERTVVMGCYGIGVSRIVAAAIEQNHDDNGIVWPLALAPFQVHVLLNNPNDAEAMGWAERITLGLESRGYDVLLDDRDERLGVKFKDADLIGVPLRVLIGGRGLKEGRLELSTRSGGVREDVPLADAVEELCRRIAALAASAPVESR
ncbi:MAG: proline--tRNA ligase [Magnetococcus sp. WYHC-3]